ncbi:MAG: spiro-SPASM protein [Treponema sp.]|jgi:spiro-SPASM protein|nr:spiro-SPASM protein [Treponema sp.]
MNALTVLFGGNLADEAFKPVFGGKSAFSLALERAAAFPGTKKVVLLGKAGMEPPGACSLITGEWTVSLLLKTLSEAAEGFDFAYYAWADTPFLDRELAGKIADRHCRFAADYSYADGWPGGLAPELLGPGTAGILCKIAGTLGEGRVERDSIFAVLQKDINSFDIETEISTVDLRYHRLNLGADSRRNLLLLERFAESGILAEDSTSAAVEKLVAEKPELLRTLPNFSTIQVTDACTETQGAGSCAFCPYRGARPVPAWESNAGAINPSGFMAPERFAELLDGIEAFAGDAVLDISLWGEIALHPECETLIGMVLERPALSLVVETSGIGWKAGAPKRIAGMVRGAPDSGSPAAPPRKNGMAALSWIVSLNENDLPVPPGVPPDPARPAAAFAGELAEYFPKMDRDQVYVQAIRTKGAEDAIERFYRAWKKSEAGIIIQKYNSFCGALPDRNAADLSPVKRRPCWHIMRDFVVLSGGGVPFCANACPELWNGNDVLLGNVFTGGLREIWERGEERYREHCREEYRGICSNCDEYYTYNF